MTSVSQKAFCLFATAAGFNALLVWRNVNNNKIAKWCDNYIQENKYINKCTQYITNDIYSQLKPLGQTSHRDNCKNFKSNLHSSSCQSPFYLQSYYKFYFSSKLEEDIASLIDWIRCLILKPTLFCRCFKNSFNSFSRFSLSKRIIITPTL